MKDQMKSVEQIFKNKDKTWLNRGWHNQDGAIFQRQSNKKEANIVETNQILIAARQPQSHLILRLSVFMIEIKKSKENKNNLGHLIIIVLVLLISQAHADDEHPLNIVLQITRYLMINGITEVSVQCSTKRLIGYKLYSV